MNTREVRVTITEKPYDPADGGPIVILRVGMSRRRGFSTILYENLQERGSGSISPAIRDWCVEQWAGEEFSFNPFDDEEVWVRSFAQAMAFKLRWDGKHAVATS